MYSIYRAIHVINVQIETNQQASLLAIVVDKLLDPASVIIIIDIGSQMVLVARGHGKSFKQLGPKCTG